MNRLNNVPAEFQPKDTTIWWVTPIGVFVNPDTWNKPIEDKIASINLSAIKAAGYRYMVLLGGWHNVKDNAADLNLWPTNSPSHGKGLGEPVILVTGNTDAAVAFAHFIRDEKRLEGPDERVLKIVLPMHNPQNTIWGRSFIEGMLEAITPQAEKVQSTTTAFTQQLTLGVKVVEFNVYNPTDVIGAYSALMS
jgi:hypothetical protein